MLSVASVPHLMVGVFFGGNELHFDPTDGYLERSSILRGGDVLALRLAVTEGSPLHFISREEQKDAKKGPWMALTTRDVASGESRRKSFDLLLPLHESKKRRILRTPPYDTNVATVVLDKKEGEMLPRVIKIAVVAQKHLFFRIDDSLNYPALLEQYEMRRMAEKKLPPKEGRWRGGKGGPPPSTVRSLIEAHVGLVRAYNDLSGDGEVTLCDEEHAFVRWSQIVTDDRFRHLEAGWGVQYQKKVLIPEELRKGRKKQYIWELRGVTVFDRRGDS